MKPGILAGTAAFTLTGAVISWIYLFSEYNKDHFLAGTITTEQELLVLSLILLGIVGGVIWILAMRNMHILGHNGWFGFAMFLTFVTVLVLLFLRSFIFCLAPCVLPVVVLLYSTLGSRRQTP
jgi:hypothetical protein